MSKTVVLSLALVLLAGAATAQTQTPVQSQGQPTAQNAAPAPSPLPGGASSIQESYEDWQVLCGVANNAKQCTIQQTQAETKTGQRVLAVSLVPAADGGSSGNLIMPFGLQFDAGVSLALDAGANGKPLPFKTCIPAGCLVPLTLDANTITALKAGKQLKLTAKSIDANVKPLVFTVSLKGFGAALDRAAAIVK